MQPTKAPSRLSEQLRETIAERIATAVYPPGTKLEETELASEFGVSRTPIREALIQLASEGLVDMRPRRGAMVAATDPHRLVEMFEVMAELEAMCGALAARRATEADQKALLEAHQSCELARESNDPDAYYWCNEAYHSAIYAASHNRFLAEQASALQRRLSPYRRLQLRVRDRMRTSYSEHTGIVDAIMAGDGELAARRLREHVVVQGERFADLIASLQSLRESEAS
ncbi:MAG TPA: GntR family transcriptional regulator [Burkholderiales bacterium]|nr:GntR family transcriptional regulator [Burkholderiales bacterium]